MNAPSFIGWVGIILMHTPGYVWLLLSAALLMGMRRLTPRRTHLALAALLPSMFLIGGLYSAASTGADAALVAAVWAICFAVGAASGAVRLVPRPRHVSGFVFDFAPTAWPLVAYLFIFAAHYALGIWAGLDPDLSTSLSVVGLALSALTAGRTSADFLALLLEVSVSRDFSLPRGECGGIEPTDMAVSPEGTKGDVALLDDEGPPFGNPR